MSVKITEFQIENVKRVRAVDYCPGEGLTVIGGDNRQGKTSILDAIAFALGGEKFRPSQPQNTEGIAPASLCVTLSNGLVVSRTGKNLDLKVTDPSGKKAGQTLLNSFIGQFALDLPKFLKSDAKAKAKVLLQTLGIERQLQELEDRERKASDERLLAGREAKRKAAYAAELPEFPDAPDTPLSGADMAKELQDALAENARHQELRSRIPTAEERVRLANDRVATLERRKAELEHDLVGALAEADEPRKALAEAKATDIPEDVDTAAISAKLEEIDEINAKVRTNAEKVKAEADAEGAREEYEAADRMVDEIREERLAFLRSVKMPLQGLSIEDGELVYDGQKWDNMSGMERVVVGISVCQMLNPQCGFVLLDGLECFDATQVGKLREWLAERNLQAIATRVAKDDTCDIIISDGMVAVREGDTPNKLIEF